VNPIIATRAIVYKIRIHADFVHWSLPCKLHLGLVTAASMPPNNLIFFLIKPSSKYIQPLQACISLLLPAPCGTVYSTEPHCGEGSPLDAAVYKANPLQRFVGVFAPQQLPAKKSAWMLIF
jgi:hypothetical protein